MPRCVQSERGSLTEVDFLYRQGSKEPEVGGMLVHFNSIQQICNRILEVRDLCKNLETKKDKTTDWAPGRMS